MNKHTATPALLWCYNQQHQQPSLDERPVSCLRLHCRRQERRRRLRGGSDQTARVHIRHFFFVCGLKTVTSCYRTESPDKQKSPNCGSVWSRLRPRFGSLVRIMVNSLLVRGVKAPRSGTRTLLCEFPSMRVGCGFEAVT